MLNTPPAAVCTRADTISDPPITLTIEHALEFPQDVGQGLLGLDDADWAACVDAGAEVIEGSVSSVGSWRSLERVDKTARRVDDSAGSTGTPLAGFSDEGLARCGRDVLSAKYRVDTVIRRILSRVNGLRRRPHHCRR